MQEEIEIKRSRILNVIKTWATIKHPYESRDAEGLMALLSLEGVVIKVDRELPYINQGRNKIANEAQLDIRDRMFEAGYVAVESLIEEE